MTEVEAAKLNLLQALREHLENVEAFATEAALLAVDAERDGDAEFARALRELARHHRAAAIKTEALVRAQVGAELTEDESGR
jgi:hypothetical protein